MENATPDLLPDGCVAVLAIVAAALVVAIMIILAGGLLPLLSFAFPLVAVATTVISLAIGFPLFLLLRRTGLLNWLSVGLSGLFTGALVPTWIVLSDLSRERASMATLVTIAGRRYLVTTWASQAAIVAGLGVAGSFGALVAWRIILGNRVRRGRGFHLGTVLLIATALAASASVHVLLTDHSCHNTLRDGRSSASPVATFNVHLPPAAWPALREEFRRFAKDRGWSFELGRGEYDRPAILDVDICRETGTEISATPSNERENIFISIYQPQDGDDWQPSFHDLQRRIELRWPGSVSYPFQPPPPWAPNGKKVMGDNRYRWQISKLSLSPAPSSATR